MHYPDKNYSVSNKNGDDDYYIYEYRMMAVVVMGSR